MSELLYFVFLRVPSWIKVLSRGGILEAMLALRQAQDEAVAAKWAMFSARFWPPAWLFAANPQPGKRLGVVKLLLNTKMCTNLSQSVIS